LPSEGPTPRVSIDDETLRGMHRSTVIRLSATLLIRFI
jgi:hypothetical protein